ncbi:MAG: hypothetical protein ACLFV7_05070, partial [Phycisphaerae bacterium]
MKWTREKWLQVAFAAGAVVLLVVAGLLRGSLDERSRRMGSLRRDVVTREHPEIALLTLAPGGLRAPVVNYLWIRIQDLKEAGRYYEAMQLSEWICSLQPRFAGVWSFHAWNMA